MYDLIRKTSTVLPDDVNKAIKKALAREENGSIAKTTLDIILKSIVLSSNKSLPICQDTGTILVMIEGRPDKSIFHLEKSIKDAIRKLTKEGILRQNCVCPLTEKNTLDNTGLYVPQVHFEPVNGPTRISIMLKDRKSVV